MDENSKELAEASEVMDALELMMAHPNQLEGETDEDYGFRKLFFERFVRELAEEGMTLEDFVETIPFRRQFIKNLQEKQKPKLPRGGSRIITLN